jgi:hypothetical protein
MTNPNIPVEATTKKEVEETKICAKAETVSQSSKSKLRELWGRGFPLPEISTILDVPQRMLEPLITDLKPGKVLNKWTDQEILRMRALAE